MCVSVATGTLRSSGLLWAWLHHLLLGTHLKECRQNPGIVSSSYAIFPRLLLKVPQQRDHVRGSGPGRSTSSSLANRGHEKPGKSHLTWEQGCCSCGQLHPSQGFIMQCVHKSEAFVQYSVSPKAGRASWQILQPVLWSLVHSALRAHPEINPGLRSYPLSK